MREIDIDRKVEKRLRGYRDNGITLNDLKPRIHQWMDSGARHPIFRSGDFEDGFELLLKREIATYVSRYGYGPEDIFR